VLKKPMMLSRSKVHVRWRREVTMRERLSLVIRASLYEKGL
jgi:hypothetical protein